MLDCLPSAADWSPHSQYAMLRDHLQALHHHLQAIDTALDAQPVREEALTEALPHLTEISERCLEAHSLLQALAQQPQDILDSLGGTTC